MTVYIRLCVGYRVVVVSAGLVGKAVGTAVKGDAVGNPVGLVGDVVVGDAVVGNAVVGDVVVGDTVVGNAVVGNAVVGNAVVGDVVVGNAVGSEVGCGAVM